MASGETCDASTTLPGTREGGALFLSRSACAALGGDGLGPTPTVVSSAPAGAAATIFEED
jgi:hypothetical protein